MICKRVLFCLARRRDLLAASFASLSIRERGGSRASRTYSGLRESKRAGGDGNSSSCSSRARAERIKGS
jgi:hypothetical protein